MAARKKYSDELLSTGCCACWVTPGEQIPPHLDDRAALYRTRLADGGH